MARSADDLNNLRDDTVTIKVFAKNHAVLEATLKRFPALRAIHVDFHPNKIEAKSIQLLRQFKQLEILVLTGDARLSDREFDELGKTSQLMGLKLVLP